MANILLTSSCNRSCPYCFARKEISGPSGDQWLSWENLIYIADFLRASGQRKVSLLGGEPTLHPQCVDFILYLIDRGFNVTVFTNGILSPSHLEEFKHHLAEMPLEKLDLLCNLNDPVQTPAAPQEMQSLHSFLAVMGPWTRAGFNIYRPDFTLDFLFDHINRFGMKRRLRLGIAHPVPGSQGSFIPTQDLRSVMARLYSFRHLFETYRISPSLDCGFPLCKFSDQELGWLYRSGSYSPFGCGPALDIAPDMTVYHCFPLSNYKRKSLFEFNSLEEINQHFSQLRDEIRAEIPGIYEECAGCRCREDGVCAGGGMCQIVRRFLGETPIRPAGIEDGISKYCLPQ
jgi:MoaA/NifB/PqqE/SkfB family radical SAM enzyme